jgi:hypothetical protein
MGETCSTKGGKGGMRIGYCWEIQRERDNEENQRGGWILER